MKIEKHARIRPAKIESTLRRIEAECRHFEAHVRMVRARRMDLPEPRLILTTKRVRHVRALLAQFERDRKKIGTTRYLPIRFSYLVLLLILAAVAHLVLGASNLRMDLTVSAMLSLVITVFPLVLTYMTNGLGIEESERRKRRELCQSQLHQVRSMLHVIDSHVAAKTLRGHWDIGNPTDEVAGAGQQEFRRDWIYADPSTALRYLAIASALARACAKIAALYPQTLPDSTLASEADELSCMAFELERNCLLKSDLIRQGALRLGTPAMIIHSAEVRIAA